MSIRYFRCTAVIELQDGQTVKRHVYGRHIDSESRQDTLDFVPQCARDLLFEVDDQFDAPIECIEITGAQVISDAQYYAAPRAARLG